MTTKKEQRQGQSIEQVAADYKALMLQIKELEKKAAPNKKALTEYAKGIGVLSLEIGGVTLEKRVTPKGTIDPGQVTPDWLYRMQRDGFAGMLSLGIDYKAVQAGLPDNILEDYLAEVGFTEKETSTYAIRI
ncbi:MAG: hypothetical protein EGQ00_02345 [Parabacteroides johnsonii]|jgi:hypothetical protein|nr:hypothetical protein [Parabacteroides johnsonii]